MKREVGEGKKRGRGDEKRDVRGEKSEGGEMKREVGDAKKARTGK